ncbi:MAG: ABC transporter permease, partial [bacterium]
WMDEIMALFLMLVKEIIRVVTVILIATLLMFFIVSSSPDISAKKDNKTYHQWIGKIIFNCDMGTTRQGEQVLSVVLSRAKNSALLIILALIFAILWTGCFLIATFKIKQKGLIVFLRFLCYGISVCPTFVVGHFLLHLSHNKLVSPEMLDDPVWYYYLVPAMILGITDGFLGETIRHAVSEINHIKSEHYVKMAQAKGASIWRHMINDFIIHMSMIISLHMVVLISGTVIIECIFCLPGIGGLAFNAAEARDTGLLLGILFFVVIIVVILNMVNRIIALCLDPRLRG